MNIAKVFNHLRSRLNSDELGMWFVLSYIYERDQQGIETRGTDLIQKLEFGTGPTVHKKILDLEDGGFIQVSASDTDGRAKCLSITDAGLVFMRDLDTTLKEALLSDRQGVAP